MKTKYIITVQVVLFLLYVIASNSSDFIANLLSPYFFWFTGIMVLMVLKHVKTNRIYWKAFMIMCLYWGTLDFIWFIMDGFTEYDPNESLILYYAYILPNMIILFCIVHYFVDKTKNWHKLQLVIDIIFLSIIVILMIVGIYFSNLEYYKIDIWDTIGTLTYLIIDMIAVSVVLIMLSSMRGRKATKELIYIMFGFGIYIANDFYYTYKYVSGTYVQNDYSDYIYLFAFLVMSVSVWIARDNSLQGNHEGFVSLNGSTVENIGKSKVIYFITPLPIILYFVDVLPLFYLLGVLIVIIQYQFLDYTAQKAIISDILLDREHGVNEQLEQMIKDRTIDLQTAHDRLAKDSITDSLTGLFNRNYFIQAIEDKIKHADSAFSIMVIDLNRFKVINDIHGHTMGDYILTIIGNRLKVQQCEHCVVARFGGDEFAIIYDNDDYLELERVSARINALISQKIFVEQYQFRLDASIGISRYPKDASSAIELMKYADIAMYHAKHSESEDNFAIHSSHFVEKVERRNYVELLLREADFENDFMLYYQPQFETRTHKLVGMEALIRWKHKKEGFISPAEFIPIAEDAGLVLTISDWVYETGINQIKTWNEKYRKDYVMCLNLPPAAADSIDFIPNLIRLIEAKSVQANWIGFEITENNAMSTALQMEEFLTALNGLGVEISIDDFGTGYSSLSYIKRFDVDTLKIAKELIDNIVTDHNDLLIIKAIIMMAEGMGLTTVAEGVESEEQLKILADLNCDLIQGFIWGRPVPAEEFEKLYLS